MNPRSTQLALLFLFLIGYFCTSYSQQEAQKEQLVQGFPCGGKVEYFDNGKISSCILSKPFSIEGYLLPKGSKVFLGLNGELGQCLLGDSAKIVGQSFPRGTWVFFNRWGQKISFWLPKNMVMQGFWIGASDDGIGNSIYPSGKLKAVWLADDQDIEGIPCTSSGNIFRFGFKVIPLGTQRMAWFHENGRLAQAMLSRDITIQGHSFSKSDIVSFDINGKIDLEAKKLE